MAGMKTHTSNPRQTGINDIYSARTSKVWLDWHFALVSVTTILYHQYVHFIFVAIYILSILSLGGKHSPSVCSLNVVLLVEGRPQGGMVLCFSRFALLPTFLARDILPCEITS